MTVSDCIQDDPHYGSIVVFWIYSCQKDQWIILSDPTYPQGSYVLREDNSSFLKALYWLNLGALLFPLGINPNESKPLAPICLPDSFLNPLGIFQDNLYEAIKTGTQAVINTSLNARTIKHEATLERKEIRIGKIKQQIEQVKPKVLTTQDVIDLMKKDWVDLNVITKPRLGIIQKKYNVIVEEDKAKIQL